MGLIAFPEDLGWRYFKINCHNLFRQKEKVWEGFLYGKVTSTLKVLMSLLLLEKVGIRPIGDIS